MDPDYMPEPSQETRVRVQGDKETARGDGSSDRLKPPWKVGDQLNDFVLEAFLGKGTSGFVYRALDTVTGRRCALKLLLEGTPEDLVRNKLGFRRMMSIEHESLMRVDRIHQLGQYIALSMEEIDGVTLTGAVRELRGGDLSCAYQQLLQLTRQYAGGLAAMHFNGYVHRDIKPQNLMVDHAGHGRVIDYGLVGTFDLETDPNGYRNYLAGTPRYFAPEVLWNQYYLPAGDIFSLGMVILEALHALSLINNTEMLIRRSDRNPRVDAEGISDAINVLDDSVPGDLREMCLEMLQPDPSDRPTAMRVARFGNVNSTVIAWPQEKPLLGRSREVAQVMTWLDEIYAGRVGRLHLRGPSGIGKTRLLDDVEKYIRSMRWGQVFRAECRPRETQPLQAFDQICDSIANRYQRGDRERLRMDAVSVAILHDIFPALKSVLQRSSQMLPADSSTQRFDALEAAVRLSHELRNVGPLILIIDDVQWADRDSLNVLDRLQSAGAEIGLGIVTVSRDVEDPQRVPATLSLDIGPLDRPAALEMLSQAADQQGVSVSQAALNDLADASGGIPFRLHELADEFRPGGALSQLNDVGDRDDSVSRLGRIDWLWQKRAERLSGDAQAVMGFVVTAGCRVSTQQLGELSGLGDAVDAAVSELVRQRLISDDATGGECIQVVHDRVADGLAETLDDRARCQAHLAWAALLLSEDHSERRAARIAGHFFAAGEPARALSFAALAADQAERLLALTEAARWHAMIIEHVDGSEKVNRLRQAARCYQEADQPLQAATYYRRLAEHLDGTERIECQMKAVSMSICGGQFSEVRSQLRELARAIGLPRPKPAWLSSLCIAARAAGAALRQRGKLQLEVSSGRPRTLRPADQRALELCILLDRPLSMFDNQYAAELVLAGEALATRLGTPLQQFHSLVGRAVFGCYDRGKRRDRAEQLLFEIPPDVERLGDLGAKGTVWAAIAHAHALSCRWNQVSEPVQLSLQYYRQAQSRGFAIAHTEYLEIWSQWQLGQWAKMFSTCDEVYDSAVRRNDLFQQLMITCGLCGNAWLGRDRTVELDRALSEQQEFAMAGPGQFFGVFALITSVQRLMYAGEFSTAWQRWESGKQSHRSMPLRRLQMLRVVRQSVGTLLALHQLDGPDSLRWYRSASRMIGQLRSERLPFALMLADLYEGLLLLDGGAAMRQSRRHRRGRDQTQLASTHLQAAAQAAREQALVPYQLAAEDALARIAGGRSPGLLRQAMERQGVTHPQRFERLFTLPIDVG